MINRSFNIRCIDEGLPETQNGEICYIDKGGGGYSLQHHEDNQENAQHFGRRIQRDGRPLPGITDVGNPDHGKIVVDGDGCVECREDDNGPEPSFPGAGKEHEFTHEADKGRDPGQ